MNTKIMDQEPRKKDDILTFPLFPNPSLLLRVLSGKILLFSFLAFLAVPCFAENEFSLRLAPAFEMPLGLPQFGAGVGANASFDWTFLPFAKNFELGISAAGSFVSISVQTGSPLALLEGKLVVCNG